METGIVNNTSTIYRVQPNTATLPVHRGAPVEGENGKKDKIRKIGVGVCTAAGVGLTMLALAKFSKKPAPVSSPKTLAEKLKNSHILNLGFNKWQNVVAVGAGSIAGGLVGGAIFDKKDNFEAKVREGVTQMFNIATPIYLVAKLSDLGKKLSASKMPKWGQSKNLLKSATSKIPQTAGAAAGLIGGMYLGNRISRKVNEVVFHKKDNRPIKWKDFSAHVDDIGVAATFIANENNLVVKSISKLIPIALIVPGVEVGNKKEMG